MSKYTKIKKAEKERLWNIHPIWRGIGFIWLLSLPVMACVGTLVLLRQTPLPSILREYFPESFYNRIRLPILDWPFLTFPIDLNMLIRWIPGYPFTIAELFFFLAILFLGFGIMSIIYSFLYRMVAPVRSPLDAPEVESRRRPRRR